MVEGKPWRQPGARTSDWFNYGFTEETWRAYCRKQTRLREENRLQNKIEVVSGSKVGGGAGSSSSSAIPGSSAASASSSAAATTSRGRQRSPSPKSRRGGGGGVGNAGGGGGGKRSRSRSRERRSRSRSADNKRRDTRGGDDRDAQRRR